MATQTIAGGGASIFRFERPEADSPERYYRLDLHYLRATALAQVRLHLAVLSGNRRRALEQIDRLVAYDKELERIAEGTHAIAPPLRQLAEDLADQRLAIAAEKLALTAGTHLPRLEPAFGAGMAGAIGPDEPVEIVEDERLKQRLSRILLWTSGFVILCTGVAAAAVMQL